MNFATGTYIGTGVNPHAITGVGFQPDAVIIQGEDKVACAKTRQSEANDPNGTIDVARTGWWFLNGIVSLDADGFTVSTDDQVNAVNLHYWYVCFGDNGMGDYIEDFYIGTGIDNLQITGFGFEPAMVMIFPRYNHGSRPVWKSDQCVGEESYSFYSTRYATNCIQQLLADGVEVGTHTNVNVNTRDFYYLAWKKVDGQFATGMYAGDNTADRPINGAGMTPKWVMQSETTALGFDNHRIDSMTVPEDWLFTGSGAGKYIHTFHDDGFTVDWIGNHSNSFLFDYYWMAWGILEEEIPELSVLEDAKPTPPEVHVIVYDADGEQIHQLYDFEELEWSLRMKGGSGPFRAVCAGEFPRRYDAHGDPMHHTQLPRHTVSIMVDNECWYQGFLQNIRHLRGNRVEISGAGVRTLYSWLSTYARTWRREGTGLANYAFTAQGIAEEFFVHARDLYGINSLGLWTNGATARLYNYTTPAQSGDELLDTLARYDEAIWGVAYMPRLEILPGLHEYFVAMPTDAGSPDDTLMTDAGLDNHFDWNDIIEQSDLEECGDEICNCLWLRGPERAADTAYGNKLNNSNFVEGYAQDCSYMVAGYWYWEDWKDWVILAETGNAAAPEPGLFTGSFRGYAPTLFGESNIGIADYGTGVANPRADPSAVWIRQQAPIVDSPGAIVTNLAYFRWDGGDARPPVTGGMQFTYCATFYVYSEHADWLKSAVCLQWYDSTDTQVGADSWGSRAGAAAWQGHAGGGWEREVWAGAAPANAVRCQVGLMVEFVGAGPAAGTVWYCYVDGAQFTRSAAAVDYQPTQHYEHIFKTSDAAFAAEPAELIASITDYELRVRFMDVGLEDEDGSGRMQDYAASYFRAYATPHWRGAFKYVGTRPRLIQPWAALVQIHDLPQLKDTRRYAAEDTNGQLACEEVIYTLRDGRLEMDMDLVSPQMVMGPSELKTVGVTPAGYARRPAMQTNWWGLRTIDYRDGQTPVTGKTDGMLK